MVGAGDRPAHLGCELEFTIIVEAQQDIVLGGISLYLESDSDQKILNFDSLREFEHVSIKMGISKVTIKTESIPLNPIALRASLWMAGLGRLEILDEVQTILYN